MVMIKYRRIGLGENPPFESGTYIHVYENGDSFLYSIGMDGLPGKRLNDRGLSPEEVSSLFEGEISSSCIRGAGAFGRSICVNYSVSLT